MDRVRPAEANAFQAGHARLLLESFQRVVGRPLLALPPGADPGRALYDAPCVLLSHDTAADPVFTYANQAAQDLFGYPWEAFVTLPSRLSAEPLVRKERDRLLARVAAHGFIGDYAGVRIAADGRRFRIHQAVVWNLVDADGGRHGQAATFSRWELLG